LGVDVEEKSVGTEDEDADEEVREKRDAGDKSQDIFW
jgi:hypothetical protein